MHMTRFDCELTRYEQRFAPQEPFSDTFAEDQLRWALDKHYSADQVTAVQSVPALSSHGPRPSRYN